MFNLGGIKGLLNGVLSNVGALTDIAGMFGIGGKLGELVGTAIDIGKNVMERVEDGTVVAKSEDKEELKALIAKLEAANAGLDQYIRNS